MTLVALRKDKKLTTLSPYIQIERGAKRTEVITRVRSMQSNEQLYCYGCFFTTGQFYPVKFRNAEGKRMHFFHLQDGEIQSKPCSNHRGESDDHLNAKEAIQIALLQKEGVISSQLEVTLESRKPDLVVTYPNGAREAHEVQISPITSEQIRQRTKEQQERSGIGRVHWYLGPKSFTRENREFCYDSGIPFYKLTFPKGIPQWEEQDKLPKAAQKLRAKKAELERCNFSSKFPNAAQKPQPIKEVQKPSNPYAIKKESKDTSFRRKRAGVELDSFIGTTQRALGDSENFNVSDLVTGVEGRVSNGWHGQVLRKEKLPHGGFIYYVHWYEREHSTHKELASFHQKQPVLSALKEHLLLCERVS